MATYKERIEQAKQVSIIDLAVNNGVEVTDVSSRYARGVKHDSLMFDKQKNTFSWFSQDKNGDTINFMQEYLGVADFNEAVKQILDGQEKNNYHNVDNEPIKREPFQYYFKNNESITEVRKYLYEERGIDNDIITALNHKGLLQQDMNQRAIFVWGRQGAPAGATVQGTQVDYDKFGKRGTAKFIGKNSQQDFGFNVSIGKPNKLMLFEAPIDLLSYWSEHKELRDTMLFSMDGLKERTVYNAMNYMYVAKNSLPTEGVFLGVDNDAAGHKFMDKFEQKAFTVADSTKEIVFHSLIPNDWDIPRDHLSIYQSISSEVGIDWQPLAAAHKATSNLDPNMYMANGYKYTGNLAYPEPLQPAQQVDRSLETELRKVAELIKDNSQSAEINWRQVFANDLHAENSDPVAKVADKAARYNEMYVNQGARPVIELQKDWNDDLRNKLNEASEGRLLNTDYASSTGTLKVSRKAEQKRSKLVAEERTFNGAVKFFEADSPREMEFLIKNYGYNAVDKQDERMMKPQRPTEARSKEASVSR